MNVCPCNIFSSFKIYLRLFIPNFTRSNLVTYTNSILTGMLSFSCFHSFSRFKQKMKRTFAVTFSFLDAFSLLYCLITLCQGVSVVSKCFVKNHESQDCDPRFLLFGNNGVIMQRRAQKKLFCTCYKSFTFIVIASLI